MRRAARVDSNQAEIVRVLRACGAEVWDLSALGDGIPDLLVGFRGRWIPLECKDGSKPPSKRRLTPAEAGVHAIARAKGLPIVVVNSTSEALKAVGIEVRE